ncbi:CinA family protein [Vibrio rumoiensis]|uniref:Damage-inducible protein CinA n=1 Tax=Vibrio rumoiensis 1S-45 TaxID=1188252 RepID=A0A1E5E4N3_9VIBR|nr:nicotinamide-nucleotide amidohydrolase family protein [Vibrio rumoiensis]OEF27803.1 damage-inducible protein CinA [Vibrio rumoiensis 1S-45]
MTYAELRVLSKRVGIKLKQQSQVLVTAESCTGGGIATAITETAGSSAWFDRSFVTYSNEAKMEMIGVKSETLLMFGAVSEQTVQEMAGGALERSKGTCSIAVSGIAGPDGGSDEKPVGTVCFAWAMGGSIIKYETVVFNGNREEVRIQACFHALDKLEDILDGD